MNQLALESNGSLPSSDQTYWVEPKLEVSVVSSQVANQRQAFLSAMSRRVSSVNLVVTDGVAGRFGLTVTSMCSVSAEPPIVMIGINRKSPLCQAITRNRCFVINVLSVAQQYLADSFAGVGPQSCTYDFAQASWCRGETSAPILSGGTAWFECDLASYQDVGSHRLFMGNVLRAEQGSEAALCYSERSYRHAQALS
ncbi:MAG: flavin reductase family protein [Halopseudomonas sp.]